MKYSVLLKGDQASVDCARNIESFLKSGKNVIAGECGGFVRMVAWPDDGIETEPILLLEGTVLNCIRRYFRCKKLGNKALFGRQNFMFGWPKSLVITETK